MLGGLIFVGFGLMLFAGAAVMLEGPFRDFGDVDRVRLGLRLLLLDIVAVIFVRALFTRRMLRRWGAEVLRSEWLYEMHLDSTAQYGFAWSYFVLHVFALLAKSADEVPGNDMDWNDVTILVLFVSIGVGRIVRWAEESDAYY